MNQIELSNTLRKIGFQFKNTLSKKWKGAFIFQRSDKLMVVLIRAHGCDVFITESRLDEITNPNKKISIYTSGDGNKFVEFFYSGSEINIHRIIIHAARSFMQCSDLPDQFFMGSGLSPAKWAEQNKYVLKLRNIRYKETCESDFAYVVEYNTLEPGMIYELLHPESSERDARIDAIYALCEEGQAGIFSIRRTLCWAEYNQGGYRVHDLLTDYQRMKVIGEMIAHRTFYGDTILIPDSGRFKFLRENYTKDGKPCFTIEFGERLPEDYFGDFDYSMYPGGYGPNQAYFGC